MRRIGRRFPWLVVVSLAVPTLAGFVLDGFTLGGALRGYIWGGLVRIFLVHHVTWSVNSICHFFGRRRFDIEDQSTNVAWLAVFSFGESWHHNHHAFPRSAYHGLRWWEIDLSGLFISTLGEVGPRVERRPHHARAPAPEDRGVEDRGVRPGALTSHTPDFAGRFGARQPFIRADQRRDGRGLGRDLAVLSRDRGCRRDICVRPRHGRGRRAGACGWFRRRDEPSWRPTRTARCSVLPTCTRIAPVLGHTLRPPASWSIRTTPGAGQGGRSAST